ncbi:uncharacterized protein LOC134652766 [Cydia amplana]|uniref:uncharacterized protein LOC134652766 n=1 Tax=Cydia amplana TaxID=1869771 RepID=UPI002FE5D35D
MKVQETVRTSVVSQRAQDFDPDRCWDERVLKKYLEECTDYEQRRRLRARIRTLMAEQEACATAVTEALAAAGEAPTDSEARGESLLLPLLQGLLGGGGERLLAGLGAASADVVADVRRSLGRLRAALAPPAAHPQARALLNLTERLEEALDAADRLDGCKKRHRRRSRAARHTVGVTHEELEEARRMVDRDQLALAPEPTTSALPSSTASTASVPSVDTSTPERRQSVDEEVSFHEAVPAQQKRAPIAHSVSYESAPVSRDAQVVERRASGPVSHEEQVVERRSSGPRKPEFHRHSIADKPKPVQAPAPAPAPAPVAAPPQPRPLSNTKSGIARIANKFNAQIEREAPPPIRRVPKRQPQPITAPTMQTRPQPEERAYRAPLYKPLPPTYNFAAPPPAEDFSKPLNRFSGNKKLRMKRANTIDIGKPLGGYRLDSDTDEDAPRRGPVVPEFSPQTDNDRKFLAFMKKNEGNENGHVNWSNRFGNIKNTFENREDRSRSSSSSSAKRFWQTTEEAPSPQVRPRKVLGDFNSDRPRVPWAAERRDISPQVPHSYPPLPQAPPKQSHYAPPLHHQTPPTNHHVPPVNYQPLPPHQHHHPPPPHHQTPPPKPVHHPPIPQSPTKPIAKPFVAKPIPVNQFSHAPMSAFKPPKKITSPVSAPALVWVPPSANQPPVLSPTSDTTPYRPKQAPSPPAPTAPWVQAVENKPRRVLSLAANKFENPSPRAIQMSPQRDRPYAFNPPTPPTYAPPPTQNYPVKAIPSQNDLAAPGLVHRLDNRPYEDNYVPKVDAQKLQIEFYEKQIREKKLRESMSNGHYKPQSQTQVQPPPYTVTDFTPANVVSTFVPLQQTPDIEKARAHKVDYLPDVVLNEAHEPAPAPAAPRHSSYAQKPRSPYTHSQQNGTHNGDVAYTNGHGLDEETTEHSSVVTRVMRGPVGQTATVTAGARTRHDPRGHAPHASAADSLKNSLDKIPRQPRRDSRAQRKRK